MCLIDTVGASEWQWGDSRSVGTYLCREASFAVEMEAQQRIMDTTERDRFFERFSRTQALWEFLWCHDALLSYKDNYGWLAKVFASVDQLLRDAEGESQDATVLRVIDS